MALPRHANGTRSNSNSIANGVDANEMLGVHRSMVEIHQQPIKAMMTNMMTIFCRAMAQGIELVINKDRQIQASKPKRTIW